jgi:putative ABC transport system permease protein
MVVTEELEGWWRDLSGACRWYLRHPARTLVVLVMLTLGIGGSVAVFAAVDAVLLQPLPYADPSHLVCLFETKRANGIQRFDVSPGNFLDWRGRAKSFSDMALFRDTERLLSNIPEPEFIRGATVSPNLFEVLGVRPARGHGFSLEPSEQIQQVVLSNTLWHRLFGGDQNIIGRSIAFDYGRPLTVVGVMPAGFRFPDSAEYWVPSEVFGPRIGLRQRGERDRQAIGRLRARTRLEAAQVEMTVVAKQLAMEYPSVNAGWSVTLVPLRDVMAESSWRGLLVASGAVLCCLVLVWVNLAVLVWVRELPRRREWAIRAALGATRWHQERRILAESLLTASVAGIVAVIVARWFLVALVAAMPTGTSLLTSANINMRVMAVAGGMVLVTMLIVGLLPARSVAGVSPWRSLTQWSIPLVGRPRLSRSVLVSLQISIAVALFVWAGLFVRSYTEAASADLGFSTRHALSAKVHVSFRLLKEVRPWYHLAEMQADLLARLRTLPGVRLAAAGTDLPLATAPITAYVVRADPVPVAVVDPLAADPVAAARHAVSPDYFRTLGIQLIHGRSFTDADAFSLEALTNPNAVPENPVAIVSESLARRLWPGRDALGRLLRLDFDMTKGPRTVIGVVRDVRYAGVERPALPEVYLPYRQAPAGAYSIIIQTDVDAAIASPWLRREVRAFDVSLSVLDVSSVDDVISESLRRSRFLATLLSLLAGLALVVAASGVYSVVAVLVERRTSEFGLRMAVGAQRHHVFLAALAEGLRPAGIGIVVGLSFVWASTRTVSALLYEVRPSDPIAVGCGVFLVTSVTIMAAVIPARRAASCNPAQVLRSE